MNPELEKEINAIKAKMTPINTAKFLVGTLISLGATAAVIGAMKGSLISARGITKLLMKLGIFVLACKAGDVAEEHFKETFDEMESAFKEGAEEIKEEKKDA